MGRYLFRSRFSLFSGEPLIIGESDEGGGVVIAQVFGSDRVTSDGRSFRCF